MELFDISQNLQGYKFGAGFILTVTIVFIIIGIISVRRAKKQDKTTTTLNWALAAILCVLVSLFGYLFNFGIFRFLLMFTMMPLWYPALFLFSVIYSTAALKKRPLSVVMRIATFVSYLLSGLLFYDGGNNYSYVFFGLFDPGAYHKYLTPTAILLFIISIVLIIAHIIWSIAENKSNKNKGNISPKNNAETYISADASIASSLQNTSDDASETTRVSAEQDSSTGNSAQ